MSIIDQMELTPQTFNQGYTSSIYVEIETILDDDGDTMLALSFYFNEVLQELKLSEFLTFLYQNEDQISEDEADFCYALARLTKVSPEHPNKFCVIGQDNMCIFFQRALSYNIPLFWAYGERRVPLTFSSEFPLSVHISQKGLTLHAKCASEMPPLGSLSFYSLMFENHNFIILNELVFVGPNQDIIDFIIDVVEQKELVYREGQECEQFLSFVSDNEHTLDWQFKNIQKHAFVPKDVPPTPLLKLGYENEQASVSLNFLYEGQEITADCQDALLRDIETGNLIKRQPALEAESQGFLMSLFTKHNLPFLLDNPKAIHDFIALCVPELQEKQWKIESDLPDFKLADKPVDLAFQIETSDNDWFHFEPNCDIFGEPHNLQEIARLMVSNNGFIKTKKGFVQLSAKSQEDINFLIKSNALQIGKSFSKRDIMPFMAMNHVQSDNPDVSSMIQKTAFKAATPSLPGAGFNGELRAYQQEGLNWMAYLATYNLGGILADDMGLGKTVQVLSFISQIENQIEDPLPVLIVGPSNVIYNWEQEGKKFLPNKNITVFAGSNRKTTELDAEVVITSYGVLKNDIDFFMNREWAAIVLDEAQQIKNSQSQNHQAVREINARFKLALTGTPVENSSSDLWSIANFVLPGYLGPLTQFQTFIEADPETIKSKLRPFMLRRTKQEVLTELPEKTEMLIGVDLNKAQLDLYKTVLDAVKKGVMSSTGKQDRMHVLTSILKLRQICLHPGLLKEINPNFDPAVINSGAFPSEKYEIVKEKIENLVQEGHKIVVFTQFTGMLDILCNWCDSQGINTERIDGQASPKQRLESVNRFQTTEKPTVFLISLKAGGVGITLTAADYVLHLDPWWNPAIENQATDRVHRMGQKNHVMVYKFIAKGTIEEKIQELQAQKRALYDSVIESDRKEAATTYFEDIKRLLTS